MELQPIQTLEFLKEAVENTQPKPERVPL